MGAAGHVHCEEALTRRTRKPTDVTSESARREYLLATVLTHAPLVLFMIDPQGRFIVSEGAGLAGIGLSPGQSVGLCVHDLYAAFPEVLAAIEKALSGESASAVTTVAGRTFDTRYLPLRNPGEQAVTGVVGIALDVTQQQQALEQARFQADVLAQSNDACIVCDMDQRITFWNPAATQLYGYLPDEALGRRVPDLLAYQWFDPADEEDASRALLTTGQWSGSFFSRHRDGHRLVVDSSTGMRRADDGTPTGFITIARDATERHHASQQLREQAAALRESEERYRLLVELSPSAILVQVKQVVVYTNEAAMRLLGADKVSDLVGLSIREFVPPEYWDRINARHEHLKTHDTTPPMVQSLRRLDGGRVIVEAIGAKCLFGGQHAVQVVLHDVGDRMRAQEAMQRANEALEVAVMQRTATLEQTVARLEHEMTERAQAQETARQRLEELAHVARQVTMGELASGLAHEINQPLAAIVNYARGVIRRLDSDNIDRITLRETSVEIAQQGERAGEIIRRMKDFLRRREPNRQPNDLNNLIRETAGFVHSDVIQFGITLQFDLHEPLPIVLVDSVQIQQVVLNLLKNAIQAIATTHGAEKTITVRTTGPGPDHTCVVTVRDTGPGLPEGKIETMFQPFISTRPDGLGLGLSISRSIIEAHSGRLWGESTAHGAVFHFTIPIPPSDPGSPPLR